MLERIENHQIWHEYVRKNRQSPKNGMNMLERIENHQIWHEYVRKQRKPPNMAWIL